MPSDAPVGEAMDALGKMLEVFGKMGVMFIQIARANQQSKKQNQSQEVNLQSQGAEGQSPTQPKQNKFAQAIQRMAQKHFGTGDVPYDKLLKHEGIANLDFKTVPAKQMDAFEQIAKQVGVPYSVVSYQPNQQNPGEQLAVVAYSKNHAAAFDQVDGLLQSRQSTQQEIDAAANSGKGQTVYEDVVADSLQNGNPHAGDIVLFGMADAQYDQGVNAMRDAGVRVFECQKDMTPEFLAQNPDMARMVGVLQTDLQTAGQVLAQEGIQPTTDAIIVDQSIAYKPHFETITHQQAYDKQQAAQQTQEAPQQAQQMDLGHMQATNLTPEQVTQFQQACAARDIPFVMSQGSSGLSDVLISDVWAQGAQEALSHAAPGKQLMQVPQDTMDQAWTPTHGPEIAKMDVAAQHAAATMQQSQAQVQPTVGEYMKVTDEALAPFNEAAQEGPGNLGPQDWHALTKGDAEFEVVPMGPTEFGTFTQTVGADVDYAATTSGGQYAVAFNDANKQAVMQAVDKAQPGLHPVRVMPEERQVPPNTVNLKDMIDQGNANPWGQNGPIQAQNTMPLNAIWNQSSGRVKTYHTSEDHARDLANTLGQSGVPHAVTPGQNGTAFVTVPEQYNNIAVQAAPTFSNAKDVLIIQPLSPQSQTASERVDSGRKSLMDRAKNPRQKDGTLLQQKAQKVIEAARSGVQKAASGVKNIARDVSKTVMAGSRGGGHER